VKVNRINLPLLDVPYITKYNATDINPVYTSYYTSYTNIPISIGNNTYNGIEMVVNIPKDLEHYKITLFIYLHP
jgi:hypothetical protein